MNEKDKKILFKISSGDYKDETQLNYDLFGSENKQIFIDAFNKQQTFIGKTKNAIKQITSGFGGIGSSVVKTAGGIVLSPFKDQLENNRPAFALADMYKMVNAIASNGFNFVGQFVSLISGSAEKATQILDNAFEREKGLLDVFAKEVGIVGDVAKDFGRSIDDISPKAHKLGIMFYEIAESTGEMVKNSQKLPIYQSETIFNALKISAAYGETVKSILISNESFRDVGISLKDATEDIEQIGKTSINQGLLAKATTKTLIENLGKLNEFGFKDGVKGLSNMVMQAQALKFNMNETFIIANKVFSPEGAIEVAGNLQVLGGAFGDLIDPIKMLYDSANNVEALQTSYLEAAKSLATYNAEQQRFEVTGANLRRAKAMADALGTSVNELTGAAIKGRVQMEAMSEIELFDLTDDQKKFVSNLSSMQGGVLGIEVSKDLAKQMSIKEGFVEFSQLTSKQMAKIADVQSSLKNKTTEQIIKDQYNVATQSLNALNSIAMSVGNAARNRYNDSDIYKTVADQIKKLDNFASMSPDEIDTKFNELISKMINPQLAELKNMAAGLGNFVGDIVQNVTPDAKQMMNNTTEKVKEYINNNIVPSIKHHLQIDIGVNMNNTDSLSNLVVDSLKKNPDAVKQLSDTLLLKSTDYLRGPTK